MMSLCQLHKDLAANRIESTKSRFYIVEMSLAVLLVSALMEWNGVFFMGGAVCMFALWRVSRDMLAPHNVAKLKAAYEARGLTMPNVPVRIWQSMHMLQALEDFDKAKKT